MRVEVIRAWPRRHESVVLDLPDGNTVTVVVDARHASDFKDAIRQVAPVVKSFDFST